ncbi:dihydrodipicolinate synthase family protein [Microbacterium hydrocarbonoxydans]|uniref:dihydrodipicolinate synthase family protein n=1 Tax=Microbacterium hydrocarbonoxydans TaxID=273678 RepID=UPI00203C23BC|nr:dihydrodipicolinate synthase family protein [Microbacterium hydrocarbonoxydans]MCM3780771.1 dihydrodipicolinate synthase family protein [Microbacterium hydrocarbonoxydans]
MSSTVFRLPSADGLRVVELNPPAPLRTSSTPSTSRIAYAAGHVVADPMRAAAGGPTVVDWEATMALRHSLWDLGLGIAESMDTAQRGMGLDAATALDLARRTLREAAGRRGSVVVGIATDQLDDGPHTLPEIADAYIAQLEDIEAAGGSVVMMASRHLARAARSADDYLAVYDRVLTAAGRPIVLHWLGEMFDPALSGYWGTNDVATASDTVLALIGAHATKVAGIKLSLLDRDHEISFRRRLPSGVRLFTGDDFNYSELVAGDDHGHSDALLGAFAAVPRFASAALARLDDGDKQGFRSILDPTVPLSRLVFEAPTRYYKVGVVWLSYLDGAQSHFRMVAGLESGRSILHLAELFAAANGIGLFADPDAAAARASAYFRAQGI